MASQRQAGSTTRITKLSLPCIVPASLRTFLHLFIPWQAQAWLLSKDDSIGRLGAIKPVAAPEAASPGALLRLNIRAA